MLIHRNDFSSKDLPNINNLLRVLSENAHDLSVGQLEHILSQKNFEIISARNECCVDSGSEQNIPHPPVDAMATVHFSNALGSCFAYIDDVVVNPGIQSKGLGTLLTKELILMAKERLAKWVGLTSAPKRAAANVIYSRLMMHMWNLKVFVLKRVNIATQDLGIFLDYSGFVRGVDLNDVYVVSTLMGRKAFISNDVIKKYSPAAVLEMVWIAFAKGADSIEVIIDAKNSVVADLLLQRFFTEKETNVYILEF